MPKLLDTKDAFVRSGQTQHVWDADHEKLRVLAIFFKWMVEDSSKLVDDMMSKATEMVMPPDLIYHCSILTYNVDIQRPTLAHQK